MNFAERIVALRKKCGMSQEQLAERLGLTRQTISKWETAQSTPELAYIVQLSEIFGVSTDFLLKGICDEAQNNNAQSSAHKAEEGIDRRYKAMIPVCMSGGMLFFEIIIIVVLAICAAVDPHTACIDGITYSGLVGWAIVQNSVPLLITVLSVSAVTLACFVICLIRFLRKNKF